MVSKNSSGLTVKSVFFSEDGNTFHSRGHLSENFSCSKPSRNLEASSHSGAQLTLGMGSRCSHGYFTQCMCCLESATPLFPQRLCAQAQKSWAFTGRKREPLGGGGGWGCGWVGVGESGISREALGGGGGGRGGGISYAGLFPCSIKVVNPIVGRLVC